MKERKTVGCELFMKATAELEEEVKKELEQSEANASSVSSIKELLHEAETGSDGESETDE